MKIYIALPAINESEYIHKTIESIVNQKTDCKFEVFVCVNQTEITAISNKLSAFSPDIYEDNQKTIKYLQELKDIPLTIIDKSSRGYGMETEKSGVGWARKITMDAICQKAADEDLILSLDADTTFNENYFQSITDNFRKHNDAVAISIPYYHNLGSDETLNRAILRYEIYMRYYLINLLRIESPYAFTALGSAIALPVKAYNAIKGLTPKKSGEDFYFLQKLCKYGKVMIWNKEHVNPSSRFSDRVFFGTGPALIKGSKGDWESYPIYDYGLFDNINKTYALFPELFKKDTKTPMSEFIRQQFKDENIWHLLRKNNPDINKFIKACHIKIDGLRILQYLKSEQKKTLHSDEENLKEFLNKFYRDKLKQKDIDISELTFNKSKISELNEIRDLLADIENSQREEKLFIKIS